MVKKIQEYIEINPQILLGKPVFKGTRIPVQVVLSMLAEGLTEDEIVDRYPDLNNNHVAAALNLASRLTDFEKVPVFDHVKAGKQVSC